MMLSAAASPHGVGIGEDESAPCPGDQRFLAPFPRVHIQGKDAALRPGCNADIRSWPTLPPCADYGGITGSIFRAVERPGMLPDTSTIRLPARAPARCGGVEREHKPAPRCVVERRAQELRRFALRRGCRSPLDVRRNLRDTHRALEVSGEGLQNLI